MVRLRRVFFLLIASIFLPLIVKTYVAPAARVLFFLHYTTFFGICIEFFAGIWGCVPKSGQL